MFLEILILILAVCGCALLGFLLGAGIALLWKAFLSYVADYVNERRYK